MPLLQLLVTRQCKPSARKPQTSDVKAKEVQIAEAETMLPGPGEFGDTAMQCDAAALRNLDQPIMAKTEDTAHLHNVGEASAPEKHYNSLDTDQASMHFQSRVAGDLISNSLPELAVQTFECFLEEDVWAFSSIMNRF